MKKLAQPSVNKRSQIKEKKIPVGRVGYVSNLNDQMIVSDAVIARIAATAREKGTMVMVVSRGNKWAVRKNGASKAYRILPTQNEAIAMAKVYSRNQNIPKVVVSDKMGNVFKTFGR